MAEAVGTKKRSKAQASAGATPAAASASAPVAAPAAATGPEATTLSMQREGSNTLTSAALETAAAGAPATAGATTTGVAPAVLSTVNMSIPASYRGLTIRELKKLARTDKGAAEALWTLYRALPAKELNRLAGNGDAMAVTVRDARARPNQRVVRAAIENRGFSREGVYEKLYADLRRARAESGIKRIAPHYLTPQVEHTIGGTMLTAMTDIPGAERPGSEPGDKDAGRSYIGRSPRAGGKYNPASEFPPAVDYKNQRQTHGHAEQNFSDQLQAALKDVPRESLKGKHVWMLVEQAACSTCAEGLRDAKEKEAAQQEKEGVLRKVSKYFPELIFEVKNIDENRTLIIQDGKILNVVKTKKKTEGGATPGGTKGGPSGTPAAGKKTTAKAGKAATAGKATAGGGKTPAKSAKPAGKSGKAAAKRATALAKSAKSSAAAPPMLETTGAEPTTTTAKGEAAHAQPSSKPTASAEAHAPAHEPTPTKAPAASQRELVNEPREPAGLKASPSTSNAAKPPSTSATNKPVPTSATEPLTAPALPARGATIPGPPVEPGLLPANAPLNPQRLKASKGEPVQPIFEGGPSARGEAIVGGAQVGLQLLNEILNYFGDREQERRVADALAEIEPLIRSHQALNPEQGATLIIYYTQWEAPPDSPLRPGPRFQRIELGFGETPDEAFEHWRDTPKLRAGLGYNVTESFGQLWVPPLAPAPPRPKEEKPLPAPPFPRLSLATFAGAATLQNVNWDVSSGFDDEGETTLEVPEGFVPRFYVLDTPKSLKLISRAAESAHIYEHSIPVEPRAVAGARLPVLDLDPWIPGGTAAAVCVYPADHATAEFFEKAPATYGSGLMTTYRNFEMVRWVRPGNVRLVR